MSGARVVVRLGVDDAPRQRKRLQSAGEVVGPLHHIPGVIDYFDLFDPDGNLLSFYREQESCEALRPN